MRHLVGVLSVVDYDIKCVCCLSGRWICEALDRERKRFNSAHASWEQLPQVDDPVELDISHTIE